MTPAALRQLSPDYVNLTITPVPAEAQDLAELTRLRAYEQSGEPLSQNELIARDRLIYGTGYGRRHKDGRIEHIPAMEMLVDRRQPATATGGGGNVGSTATIVSWQTTGGLIASSGTGGGGGSGNAIAVAFTRKPTDEERATRTLPPMVARMPALSEHIILIRADGIESTITIDHSPTAVYGGCRSSLSFDSIVTLDAVKLLEGLYHRQTPFTVECGALFKSSCVLVGSLSVISRSGLSARVRVEFRAIGDAR